MFIHAFENSGMNVFQKGKNIRCDQQGMKQDGKKMSSQTQTTGRVGLA